MHRHFIERDDFEVMVASASRATGTTMAAFEVKVAYPLQRLLRTRFVRFAYNAGYLWNWFMLPSALLTMARVFRPDVIFTVPDNWHCGLAWQLARTLNVPLVVNFQDLFPLSHFLPEAEKPFSGIREWLTRRFRYLNGRADLVFYTSEGMRDWFGGHLNGHVLYPVGDADVVRAEYRTPAVSGPWTVVYAGNCYGAYGRMLLALATESLNWPHLHLQIFAAGNDWPLEIVERMRAAGIFKGFVPFKDLKPFIEKADVCLTVMSFEKEEEPFVRTSFTTKWLDYAPYGKPIIAWAPTYSTAADFSRTTGAGIAVEDQSPTVVLSTIETLMSNPLQCVEASKASVRAAAQELNPLRLHDLLRTRLHALMDQGSTEGQVR